MKDLLVNVAFISVVPANKVTDNKYFNQVIAADFFRELFGEPAGQVLSFFVVISSIGTAASMMWR